MEGREEGWRGPGTGRVLADPSQLCRQVAELEKGIDELGGEEKQVSCLNIEEFCPSLGLCVVRRCPRSVH